MNIKIILTLRKEISIQAKLLTKAKSENYFSISRFLQCNFPFSAKIDWNKYFRRWHGNQICKILLNRWRSFRCALCLDLFSINRINIQTLVLQTIDDNNFTLWTDFLLVTRTQFLRLCNRWARMIALFSPWRCQTSLVSLQNTERTAYFV